MVPSRLKQLDAVRTKLAHLEKTVEAELRQELSELHKQYGFSDLKSFFRAVRAATGSGIHGKGGRAGRPKKTVAPRKRRKRAKITDSVRAKVKKLVKAGKTGSQIANAAGISLPSVQNIKKAFGLVKSRAAKARKAPSRKRPAPKKPARKAPAQAAAAPQAPVPPAAG
jgi:hypothetical protein